MVKNMAKIKGMAFVMAVLVASFAILGLALTIYRYMAEKPVATVQILKICQKEGGESYWGGYFPGEYFANVQILDITDEDAFQEIAQKISKDGQRANINFSGETPKVGKPYDCYGKNSLRGHGIVGKWDNFSDNWKVASFQCFGICVLIFGIFLIILAIKSEKK